VIETNAAETIDKTVEPVTEPEVAEMFVEPGLIELTRPVAEITATFGAEEFQTALPVRSFVLPSL
jgi:hypothetical protein